MPLMLVWGLGDNYWWSYEVGKFEG